MNSFESLPDNSYNQQINLLHTYSTKSLTESGGLSIMRNFYDKLQPVRQRILNGGCEEIDYECDINLVDPVIEELMIVDSYCSFFEAELPLAVAVSQKINEIGDLALRYGIVKVNSRGEMFGMGYPLFMLDIITGEINIDSFIGKEERIIEAALNIDKKQKELSWSPIRPTPGTRNKNKYIEYL